MTNEAKKESKKLRRTLRSGSYTALMCVILAVIVVFINLIIGVLPKNYVKIDLTADGVYSVGETTRQVLDTVSDDIRMYLIYQESQRDDTVYNFLERYAALCPKIQIIEVDPVVNPSFTSAYTDESLEENSLIVVGPKRNAVIQRSDLYRIYVEAENTYMTAAEYSSYSQWMNMYGMGSGVSGELFFFGEQEITSSIDYVTTDNIPTVYYTSMHGETEINSSYTQSIDEENMALSELDLATVTAIPEDAEAIIVNSPTIDFTEDEITMMKEYLTGGGSVVLLTDYNSNVNESLPNIAALCDYMGLESEDGIVYDPDSSIANQTYNIIPEINPASLPATFMRSTNVRVQMPCAHGIKAKENSSSAYTVTPILTTTENAFIKKNTDNVAETAEKSDGDVSGQYYLGAHVNVGMAGSPDAGNFFWYSSSNILYPYFINNGNGDLFMSTLNAVCDKATSISIIGKSLDTGYLTIDNFESMFWKTVVNVVVPLAVIVTGFGLWYRRRTR